MSEYTPHIGVREITTNDGDFLIDMVLEAVNWDRENGLFAVWVGIMG